MKNNISFRLAMASTRKDKKNYIISFIMMIIAFTFTITFSTFLSTQEKVERIHREQDYGDWVVCYEGLSDSSQKLYESSKLVDKLTTLEVIGQLRNNHYIANYNEDYFTISNISLVEGRIPATKDEVIVLENTRYNLNDMIEIEYLKPDKKTYQYKVVGIINDYNKKWSVPSAAYFTYNGDVYKEYSYITSDYSLSSFIERDENNIYNFSLMSDDLKFERDSQYSYRDQLSLNRNKTYSTSYVNIFILVVAVGLFVAIFDNVKEREKTLFLLRCIGMSKKDIKKYIFYEIIIISLIAVMISIVLSVLLSLFICYLYSRYTGIFVFGSSIINSLQYILTIMVFIIVITYLSILPFSLRSMDSLIHKKTRTVLKKYSKAKRMSIPVIARKILNRNSSYYANIILLIILQTVTVSGIFENIQTLKNDTNLTTIDENISYEYIYKLDDEHLINNLNGLYDDYKLYQYASFDGINQQQQLIWDLTVFPLDGLEDRLVEGRLPENKNECLVYDCYGYNELSIGDSVTIAKTSNMSLYEHEGVIYFDENGNETQTLNGVNLIVVGKINMSDYYRFVEENYFYQWIDMSSHGLVVLEDAIDENEWRYSSYVKSNNNLYYDFYEAMKDNQQETMNDEYFSITQNLYMRVIKERTNLQSYVMNQLFIRVPLLIISIVFMFNSIKVLVSHINKDLKLIRCLGMTFKQAIMVYLCIGVSIGILPLIYYLPNIWLYSQFMNMGSILSIMMKYIPCIIINVVIFWIFAYVTTSKDVVFYPTDVERYY